MLARLSLLFSLVLACSGCFQISKASRDSDEEEWGAKWGTDDVKGRKPPPEERPEEEPPPGPAIGATDRRESFIALPPPSPMEDRAQSRPATPRTMQPAPPPPPAKQPVKIAKKKPKKKPKKKRRKKPGRKKKRKKKLVPEEPPVEELPSPEPKPPPAPVMYPEEVKETRPPPVPAPGVSRPSSHSEDKPKPPPPQKREVVVTPAPPPTDPLFMLEVVGGVLMIPRGTRLQPGGGVEFGVSLGRLAGWRGLYLTADLDVLVGERQLHADTYLLLDGLLGVQGRIPVWKLKIIAGLGFGLRYMVLTGDPGEREPELGFGAAAVCGVEVPISGLFSAVVLADARYMREPEFGSFHLTSMFSAGVVFSF